MSARQASPWARLRGAVVALAAAPLVRWAASGGVLAAVALALWGATPGSVAGSLPGDAGWRLPDLAPPALEAADAHRRDTPLWSSQPEPEPPAVAGPPPPPRLVAVFRTAAREEAVFLSPTGQRRRAAVGASLDGGFAVEAIEATRVRLRAEDGRVLELRLLDASPSPP